MRARVLVAAVVGLVLPFLWPGPAAAETVDPAEDVYAFGDAAFLGSPGDLDLNRPLVHIAATPSGGGYWLVASDGGIFSYGDAAFHGSAGNIDLNEPIVGMAATPSGGGYWLVASDGGIFSYGDAAFHGSAGNIDLNEPIVGMAATPTGRGYWLVASDGGIFSYGDAAFHGSAGNIDLNEPIVGMAATPTGRGYWLVASDGGIFSYGDAAFHGSAGNIDLNEPIVGMAATPTGRGYWLAARDGGIFSYGDAAFHGSAADDELTKPVTGIAATPSGDGYWLGAINVRVCRTQDLVVAFPPRWETNDPDEAGACRYFHPGPFDIEGPAGRFDLAISLFDDPVDWAVASDADPNAREVSRERTAVDGRRTAVIEKVSTGDGLLPRGTFSYQYLVDLGGGRTLLATTYDVADTDEEYRRHKDVLDDMMGDLDIR